MDEKNNIKDEYKQQQTNVSINAPENKPDPLNMPDKKVVDYTYTW